jgi:hypothetical protein
VRGYESGDSCATPRKLPANGSDEKQEHESADEAKKSDVTSKEPRRGRRCAGHVCREWLTRRLRWLVRDAVEKHRDGERDEDHEPDERDSDAIRESFTSKAS